MTNKEFSRLGKLAKLNPGIYRRRHIIEKANRRARKPKKVAPETPQEVSELTNLKGIGPKLSSALIKAGIQTLADLAASDSKTLKAKLKSELFPGSLKKVSGWIKAAQSQLTQSAGASISDDDQVVVIVGAEAETPAGIAEITDDRDIPA